MEYLPRQLEFMEAVDIHPYTAYIGGVGSGKTHVLNLQGLREASIPGSRGLIGAPSYRMLYDVTMKKFFELCPTEWIAEYHKSRDIVKLVNGSEVIFRSFDNAEGLQGHDLDWFGGDEMGLVKLEVFRQLQARLRRPGGRHKGFIVGNPSGPTHWTYEYFVVKAEALPDTYKLVRATSYENAFVPDSYTGEMEKSYGKDSLYYRRFVLGEFVAFEGAYWPNFNTRPYPEGHVVKGGADCLSDIKSILRPRDKHQWYFGRVVDFGFEHPFVNMWWVHDGHSIIFYDEYFKPHGTILEHMSAIRLKEKQHKEWFGVHHHSVSWTDHDGQGRHEIHNCRDHTGTWIGFPCSPCEKNKFVMDSIICVQALIEQNRLFISDWCENARLEIPSYRAKPIDKSVKEEPIKEKDDTCDCIRMASWMEMRSVMDFLRAAAESTVITTPPSQIEFKRVTPSSMQDEFRAYGPDMLRD